MAHLTKTKNEWVLRVPSHELLSMFVQPEVRNYTGADLLAMLVLNKLPSPLREESNKFPKRTVGFENTDVIVKLEME